MSTPTISAAARLQPVTVTSLGYELLARSEKARALAQAFFKGGVTCAEVARIEPGQWKDLTADLKRAGVLRPYATVHGAETIARTILELAKLEQTRRRRCSHGVVTPRPARRATGNSGHYAEVAA